MAFMTSIRCTAPGSLQLGAPAHGRPLSPRPPSLPAVLRYEVTHPVVNDGAMTMWRQLGVSSWPTLAVVSPQGKLIAMLAGGRGPAARFLRLFSPFLAWCLAGFRARALMRGAPRSPPQPAGCPHCRGRASLSCSPPHGRPAQRAAALSSRPGRCVHTPAALLAGACSRTTCAIPTPTPTPTPPVQSPTQPTRRPPPHPTIQSLTPPTHTQARATARTWTTSWPPAWSCTASRACWTTRLCQRRWSATATRAWRPRRCASRVRRRRLRHGNHWGLPLKIFNVHAQSDRDTNTG